MDHYYEGCLYFTANRLSRIMTRMAEEAFAATGLSPAYVLLLMALHEKNGMNQKELGEVLHLKPSTITRFIEKLQAQGFVYTRQEGRWSRTYLTDKGMAIQPVIQECWCTLHDRYAAVLGREEGDALTRRMYEASRLLERA